MQALNPRIQRKLIPTICSNCLRRLRKPWHTSTPATSYLHTSRSIFSSSSAAQEQVQPLGDYYADILAQPIPPKSSASSTVPRNSLPTFVPSGDLSKEERAARLFGTVKGSGYEHQVSPESTWKTINGVAVPPRPAEPDNCCMSGCVHCVWDDYRDDIEQWAGRLKEAQAKGLSRDRGGASKEGKGSKANVSKRPEVEVASGSMDDDGGGSEALWDTPNKPTGEDSTAEELFQGIPIGIREFMATEKRIRERKRSRRKS